MDAPRNEFGAAPMPPDLLAAAIFHLAAEELELTAFTAAPAGSLARSASSDEDPGRSTVFDSIHRQATLERTYESLVRQRSILRNKTKRSASVEIDARVNEVSRELKNNVSTLCRGLRESGRAEDETVRIEEERTSVIDLLKTLADDLHAGAGLRALHDAVGRATVETTTLSDARTRDDQLTAEVAHLSSALATEESAHVRTMEARRRELQQLKGQMQQLRHADAATLRFCKKEAAAWGDTLTANGSVEETQLAAQLRAVVASQREEEEAHAVTMAQLRREQEAFSSATRQWKAQQTADVEAEIAELAEWRASREAQTAELLTLRSRYRSDVEGLVQRKVRAPASTSTLRLVQRKVRARACQRRCLPRWRGRSLALNRGPPADRRPVDGKWSAMHHSRYQSAPIYLRTP